MTRMSRVGRIAEIKMVLYRQHTRKPKQAVSVGFIARRMGLKSSTYLKNLLKEICSQDNGYEIVSAGDHHLYRFMPYAQQSFEERFFTINGSKRKVADWVADMRGLEQVS